MFLAAKSRWMHCTEQQVKTTMTIHNFYNTIRYNCTQSINQLTAYGFVTNHLHCLESRLLFKSQFQIMIILNGIVTQSSPSLSIFRRHLKTILPWFIIIILLFSTFMRFRALWNHNSYYKPRKKFDWHWRWHSIRNKNKQHAYKLRVE